MPKNKILKQNMSQKSLTNKNQIEVNEDVVVIPKEKAISPYFIELSHDVENIKNNIANTKKSLDDLKSYLESEHKIYNEIKDRAFEIQKQIINADNQKVNSKINKDEYIFFDFENNKYSSNTINMMPECYLENDNNLHLCKENGIYVNKEIYTASRMFLANNEQIKNDSKYINSFEKIINATSDLFNIKNKYTYFCMLPEAIDDFNTKIRNKLMTKNGRIISIPKSISVTYSIINELKFGERYAIIDMDGMYPIVTQITIGQDKEDNKIILREGFIKNHSIKYSYLMFSEAYVKLFEEKYSVSFTEIEKYNLIQNKYLYKICIEKEEVILFRAKNKISVIFDEEIYQKCTQQFLTNNMTFNNISKIFNVSTISGLILGTNVFELNPSAAFDGLRLIREKMINEKDPVIWKERLPKVSLEVIDDTGRFKEIDLIEEDSEAQNIQLTLDTEIELPFKGTITLQKDKKEYYLPLKRDIYLEDINSEKEAYFKHKIFPNKDDILVELVVRYNYLSDSPIKLYARPKKAIEDFEELQNEWVDTHDIKVYSGPTYEGHPKEIKLIKDDTFQILIKNINQFIYGQKKLSKEYFIQKFEDQIHQDFQILTNKYFFLKSTFDTDNVKKNDFEEMYYNLRLSEFYESVYQATLVTSNLYNKDDAKRFKNYQQGLLIIVADMIVASWYFDPKDQNILSIYKQIVNIKKTRVYIKLSRCIASQEDDIYNVFDKLTTKISSYYEKNYETDYRDKRIDYIRTMSQNCWFNKNWMKLFYESPNGHKAVNLVTNYILEYLKKEIYREDKEYRDIMEFLVNLTMVKNYNQSFFNPNKSETKELLSIVKKSYNVARKFKADNLKSRLMMKEDQGLLFGYPNYIYILIMILSGEGQINLVGYRDE